MLYSKYIHYTGEENTMHYKEIILNILTQQEEINQCLNTLEKLDANGAPTSELLHVSRFLALEKVNLTNNTNSTATVEDIFNELKTVTAIDNTESNAMSLQLSGILDSVLQKLSKTENNIYIYRYFFLCSIDNISKLCNCPAYNITKTLTSVNATLKAALRKANLQCNTETLLKSFADIDEKYLNLALSNSSKDFDGVLQECDEDNINGTRKKFNIPWKKLLNISCAILFVVLIIANVNHVINSFSEKDSLPKENVTPPVEQVNEYEDLFTYVDGIEAVDINKLLSYKSDKNITDDNFIYESDHFVGFYYTFPLKDSVPLEDCIGSELKEYGNDTKSYYTLKGINGLQYIIKKSYDTYSLLVLSHIGPMNNLDESISGTAYLEIWKTFYGTAYPNTIKKITVQHGSSNLTFNDTNVKKLIDNTDDIYNIFNIMLNSEYFGEPYEYTSDICYSSFEHLMATSVQLIIEKEDGTTIDTIYYRPEYNYFFDPYSSLAFAPSQNYESRFFEPTGEDTGIFIDDSTKTNYQGAYLDSMLEFSQHKVEPTDPENWNIEISTYDATRTTISICVNQTSDTKPINGLYIQEDFILEKYEDNKWVELPIVNGYSNRPHTLFYDELDVLSTVNDEHYFIENKYKRPSAPGKYRLTITICDSNSKDSSNPASRDYSVEFELDENYFN